MDYDKLIERLYQHNKDYGEGRTQDFFRVCLDCKDAATAIETLRADLARVTAERDAAVDELHGKCSACSHYTPYHNDGPCASCKFEVACFVPEKATDKWEWRGIKED